MEQDPPVDERAQLERRANSGSTWFQWIAALSLINSVMHFAGSDFGFLAGLGITTFVDAVVHKMGTTARVVGLILDIGIAGAWVGMGLLAKRHRIGFILGLIFYTLDTLLFILAQEWMSVAFHAWVLFSVVMGLRAAIALSKLPPPAEPEPQ